MVYSIDNKESFEHIKSWHREIKLQSNPNVKTFLIGNKSDLESSREVTTEMAELFKEEEGFDFFIETSAKTGFNAENVFIEAVKELYIDYNSYNEVSSRLSTTMINTNLPMPRKTLLPVQEEEVEKGCCK